MGEVGHGSAVKAHYLANALTAVRLLDTLSQQ